MKMKVLMTGAALALAAAVCLVPAKAEAAPEIMPDGTVFDGEYYAANNPDVVAAMGTSTAALYAHYQVCGKTEGRLATAASGDGFDAAYYAAKYPQVAAVMGTDANMLFFHYAVCGKTEGRFPNQAAENGRPAATTTTTATNTDASVNVNTYDYKLSMAKKAADYVNAKRAEEGKGELQWSDSLAEVAMIRAAELAESNSENRPNGQSFKSLLQEKGISYDEAGQCIIVGLENPDEAVRNWSRGDNKKEVLLGKYKKMAVGYDPYAGGSWVLIVTKG
ncbi:MAG: hypothetical protein IKO53_00770 [Lachnospiraceae bacterium]|nr:hypothetical protein [Lachnospiraceae bacterium]